jgi:hypothetical protein
MTSMTSRRVASHPQLRAGMLPNPAMARAARWSSDEWPWQGQDVIRVAWMTLLGLTGLGVCWFGASGAADFQNQINWIAGAAAALVLAGIGMIGWLLAGFREVHRASHQVATVLRTDYLHLTMANALDDDLTSPARSAAVPSQSPDTYVVGPAMTRAHTPDCLLVRGKAVVEIAAADIRWRGLESCEVCCS